MIITIDGPAGSGKSTIAKKVAEDLGFTHFDTGALYRSLTYFFLRKNIQVNQQDAMLQSLKDFDFSIQRQGNEKTYFLGEENITDAIRSREVTEHVSQVAKIGEIREHLVKIQRAFAKDHDCVFEGRDLGTVIFPQADLKIFITATAEIRAHRRYKELLEKQKDCANTFNEDKILKSIQKRDQEDSQRKHSPLKKADDAVEIDSSNLSIQEVVQEVVKLAKR